MSTPASVAKHPIHPMVVVFPVGLWIFSLGADLLVLAGWENPWRDVAWCTMAGGIAGALLAAIPGSLDFFAITEAKARLIAIYHLALTLSATAVFAVDLYLRLAAAAPDSLPLVLSITGVALLVAGGWLGGELVYVQRVGVEPAGIRRPPELREIRGGKIRRIG